MKRLIACVCAAAVVAVPASALGGLAFPPDNDFQGRLEGDPNTYFGFNLNKQKGKVRHLAIALPLNCYNGDHAIVTAVAKGSLDFLDPGRGLASVVAKHRNR